MKTKHISPWCRIFSLALLLTPGFAFGQTPPIATNSGPIVRITSPANNEVFFAPATIPIFAYASDVTRRYLPVTTNIGPSNVVALITNVEFYAGTNDLGPGHRVPFLPILPIAVSSLNEWELTWSNAPVGTNLLTAVASDLYGASATSAPVSIAILTAPTPPTNRPPIVTIVASDPVAVEGTNCWVWRGLTNATPSWTNWPPVSVPIYFTNCAPKSGAFTVHRFGPTNDDLTVPYSVGGTATNGVDYLLLPGTVTIPAGSLSAQIPVVPLDAGTPPQDSTVVLALAPSTNTPPDYVVGFPGKAAVIIIDSDLPRPLSGFLGTNAFHFTATGPDGAWFYIQHSTNLVNWTSVCTNQVIEGAIDFIDPSAGSGSGYYRAVPLPNGGQ